MPKSPEVRLSPKAQADIEAIFDYTDAQWGWRQAEDYVAELRLALANLTEPLAVAKSAKNIRKGYFVLRCGSHNVFFRKKPDAILIIRIFAPNNGPETPSSLNARTGLPTCSFAQSV